MIQTDLKTLKAVVQIQLFQIYVCMRMNSIFVEKDCYPKNRRAGHKI